MKRDLADSGSVVAGAVPLVGGVSLATEVKYFFLCSVILSFAVHSLFLLWESLISLQST